MKLRSRAISRLSDAYSEGARYLDQNLDRIGCKGSHASRQGRRAELCARTGRKRRSEARRGRGQERWSRVSERARPTPSCSCLPPTACNFLAKALMRGLARHGRSPDDRWAGGAEVAARPGRSRKLTPPCVSLSPAARFLPHSRSLGPSSRLSPRLRVFLTSCLRPLCAFSLPPQRMEVVCSRAVRLEVVLPCTWIPIYAQIRTQAGRGSI